MSNKTRRLDIHTFDDFVEEAKMLPDGNEPRMSVTDPLELYFFEVADKHGIIDAILDDEGDAYY